MHLGSITTIIMAYFYFAFQEGNTTAIPTKEDMCKPDKEQVCCDEDKELSSTHVRVSIESDVKIDAKLVKFNIHCILYL